MEFPATETAVPFKTKPISIAVVRADMRSQTLQELAKAAVEEVKKLPEVKEEELTVGGVESLPIADAEGNRVIRVKATVPQPKPRPGPGGGLIIGPVIAGGTGYWQYEVVMSPTGKAVSVARAKRLLRCPRHEDFHAGRRGRRRRVAQRRASLGVRLGRENARAGDRPGCVPVENG